MLSCRALLETSSHKPSGRSLALEIVVGFIQAPTSHDSAVVAVHTISRYTMTLILLWHKPDLLEQLEKHIMYTSHTPHNTAMIDQESTLSCGTSTHSLPYKNIFLRPASSHGTCVFSISGK